MKIKSKFKAVCAFALTLTLAFCGCRDKKSESGGGSGPEGGSGSPTRAAFKPLVGKDAKYVLGVNLDKRVLSKALDAICEKLLVALKGASPRFRDGTVSSKDVRELEEMSAKFKEQLAAFKDDPFKDTPKDFQGFLDACGLRNPELNWGVLSLENFRLVDDVPLLDGLSFAVSGKVDLEKVITAIQKESNGNLAFKETKLEGETVWHLVPQGEWAFRIGRKMREAHIDPYVTSLDGQLVLAAASRETLAKQVLLYRKGEGKGALLHGFSASDGDFVCLHVSGVGTLLREHVPPRVLNGPISGLENGNGILPGLKDLVAEIKMHSDGSLWGGVQLETASKEDAEQLRTFATGDLKRATQAPNISPDLKRAVERVSVGGALSRFEIRNVDVNSMLIGAFMPLVSSAMLNANLNSMATQGRKLVTGIIQANIDRQGKADPVWPRTWRDGGSSDTSADVADRAYKSATDYFNALFDMGHYGNSQWEPFVDGELLSSLWGFGVPGMSGKRLESQNIAWNVAANVTDETPDFMPVLISANFNPKLLPPGKFDGRDNTPLPIGPGSGASKSMFGDEGIVIVRKSGAAEAIKKKYLTLSVLYNRQSFDDSAREHPIIWLTPTGAVTPVGHE